MQLCRWITRGITHGAYCALPLVLALAGSRPALAQPSPREEPPPTVLPTHLAMNDAVQLARTRGYDILIAQAEVRGAEADIRTAGQLPNPLLNGGVSNTPGCDACGSPWGFNAALSDNGLIEGALSRKRALRENVANRALEAAKYSRADAERILVAQTKIQYVQTAAAFAKLDFTRTVAKSLAQSVDVTHARAGTLDTGQIARVEQEAMKAEQEVDRATRNLREQQVELGVLLGATGSIPELTVDRDVLSYRVPAPLTNVDKNALVRLALESRPDRRVALANEAKGEAGIELARRLRFPDISLSLGYGQQGTGGAAPTPPTFTVGVGVPIPLLYQQQGEIRRAEADREAAFYARRKLDASVTGDIESAYNAFVTARSIVNRYENGMLDRAKKAQEITQIQFKAGSGTLTDLLDAQRSFVQANSDYYDELVNYWTAVFQLEQAVGKELAQ